MMRWLLVCAGLWSVLLALTYRDNLGAFTRKVSADVGGVVKLAWAEPGAERKHLP